MNKKLRRYILYLIIAVLSVGLDRFTKLLVESKLKGTDGISGVIPKIFNFTYVENRGAAWGMFADNRWVFMVISTVAIVLIMFLLYFYAEKTPAFCLPLTFILAGGIGNMIDRVDLGYVIDFIQFDFYKSFPVFNIADVFITVGAVWLAVYMIFFDKTVIKEKKTESKTDEI